MRVAALALVGLVGALGCEPAEPPTAPRPDAVRAEGAVRRAEVRALLDVLARGHDPEAVSEADVQALYDARIGGLPLPARLPLEEVEGELREELADRQRFGDLRDLLQQLEREHVERRPEAIDRLSTLPIRFDEEAGR